MPGLHSTPSPSLYAVRSVACIAGFGRAKGVGELHDHARSGRPAIYRQELQMRIVAFYCQTQPLPGAGRWTLRWAERRLRSDSAVVGGIAQ